MQQAPDFTITSSDLTAFAADRWTHRTDDAVFQLVGPGTIDCVQGILTNDIVQAGTQALVWGALLTPKGMIISDLWVKRDGQSAWLIVPRFARDTVKQLLARSFPPRLTRVTDRTDEMTVRWLVAPSAADLGEIPGAIRPHENAPFDGLLLLSPEDAEHADQRLREAGWREAGPDWTAARKVVMEWPTLGREIDEKTLVQEVRFDELRGVKYDKGCFTGQETVARLHFRGHANRELRRIMLSAVPETLEITADGKVTGRIGTWGFLGEEITALAVVRKAKD